MYILVDSVLTSARGEVADVTIKRAKAFAVVDAEVTVQRYHPSRQGIMVAETVADLLPTTPKSKSKFAKIVVSIYDAI